MSNIRRLGGYATSQGPFAGDLIFNASSVSSAVLPSFNDSQGSIFLNDGNGNKRAISWSPSGYTLVNNGSTLAQYPEAWADPPHTTATTYYVDATGGNNGNAGTSEGAAWQTLAHVGLQSFNAGDEILFKRGETWTEKLTCPSSGTSGNYIKFGAYPDTGALPIFDGNDALDDLIDTNSQDYLWFDSIHTTDSATNNRGTGGIYNDGEANYFTNCVSDFNDGDGMYTPGTVTEGPRCYNCTFDSNGNDGAGISTSAFNVINAIYRACTFTNNGVASAQNFMGNGFHGYVRGIEISGCTFTNNGSKNQTANGLSHGMYLDTQGNGSETITSIRVHDNTFNDHGVDSEGEYAGIAALMKAGGECYRNRIYDNSGRGHQISQFTSGSPGARLDTHHNETFNNSKAGEGATDDFVQQQASTYTGTVEWNIFNNTISQTGIGNLIRIEDDTEVTLTIQNNILYDTAAWAYRMDQAPASSETIDYNLVFQWGTNTSRYAGVSENWSAHQTRGLDTNGANSDPLFTDAANGDFSLGASSPAISLGTDAVPQVANDPDSWIGINYVPHATSPDAGARQYLSGKTLQFSEYFLGLQCNGATATAISVWSSTKTESELQSLTS